MSRIDFEPEEGKFQREIQAALNGGRPWPSPCPTPDLLMAARSGVSFEGSEAVQSHMAVCPICEQLVRDLGEYEFPGVSDAEDRRIRARWQDRGAGPGWWGLRSWRFVAAAGALAVVLLAILVLSNTRQGIQEIKSPPKEAARQTAPAAPESAQKATAAFTLAKAAIKLPASAVLTFRGNAGDARTYLADLAAALEPYRRDDYAEAAHRLSAVARKYAHTAAPAYYEGVSQLFLNENESAIESLQAARRRAGETLADDISWYLVLAFHRAGRTSRALQEAEALCRRAGEYKERACAAAAEVRQR